MKVAADVFCLVSVFFLSLSLGPKIAQLFISMRDRAIVSRTLVWLNLVCRNNYKDDSPIEKAGTLLYDLRCEGRICRYS